MDVMLVVVGGLKGELLAWTVYRGKLNKSYVTSYFINRWSNRQAQRAREVS